MKSTTRGWHVGAIVGVVLGLAGTVVAAERAPARRSVPESLPGEARVIVKFKSTASVLRATPFETGVRTSSTAARQTLQARADLLGDRVGAKLSAGRALSADTQVLTASGLGAEALVNKLRADGDVEYAEVDRLRTWLAAPVRTPTDPLYAPSSGVSPAVGQWYLKPPSGAVQASINAPNAWGITTGQAGVVVAVLDTGIRADHPDLAGQLVDGYDMVTDTRIANDGSARDADPSDPGDFITSTDRASSFFGDCSLADSSWHGTQVSGLVAAAWNGTGMAGVAPGSKVLPVRVLGKCGGYDSDIVAGMRWAAGIRVPGLPVNTHPAKVLNMSLGGDGSCTSVYSSAVSDVATAGAVVVVAAGNSAGHAVGVPANCTGVIAVAGLRHIGTKVGFSDVGTQVAISAPGGNCVNTTGECLYPILSTSNAGTRGPGAASYTTGGADAAVGTSFSAPLVAGTAALMLSANPTMTPDQVASLIRSTARPFPSSGAGSGVAMCHAPNNTEQDECYCTTTTCGAGMLDASAAVLAAVNLGGASVVQAQAWVSPVLPEPSQVVKLSAAGSLLALGRTVQTVSWTLPDGGNIVTGFEGATNTTEVTVRPTGSGTFTARAFVQDDQGASSSIDRTVTVDALTVSLAPATSTLPATQTFTLTATPVLGAGRSVASYAWSVSEGTSVVTLSGSTSGPTVTVVGRTAGTAKVQVLVTDDLNKQVAATWSGTVTAGTTTTTSTATADAGGGGGGASSTALLLGLFGAVAGLVTTGARRRRS